VAYFAIHFKRRNQAQRIIFNVAARIYIKLVRSL